MKTEWVLTKVYLKPQVMFHNTFELSFFFPEINLNDSAVLYTLKYAPH